MHPSVSEEITQGVRLFFRTFVPNPQDRQPIDSLFIFFVALPVHYLPLLFMAYLARRPNTYLIRLLLLPITLTSLLHAGFGYYYVQPLLNVYNFGLACLAEVAISRAVLFALTKEGMIKHGEVGPRISKGKEKAPATIQQNGRVEVEFDLKQRQSSSYRTLGMDVSNGLKDSYELVTTCRGLHFKFSEGLYIPPPTRPQSPRSAFLKATIRSFLTNYLILDVVEALLKLIPGVGEPLGGSMFFPKLSPVARYAVSTTIHFMTGTCLLAGFGMVYDLITLVNVGILNDDVRNWPPVMERPFSGTSLHDFWARRWHQLLRVTFLVIGGYPLAFLFTIPINTFLSICPQSAFLKKCNRSVYKASLIFGTFLGSALFHESSIQAMGRGVSWQPVIFFAAQAPLLFLERVWRAVTGHHVGGRIGTFWVWLVIVGGGQGMIDSWHRRGLGGGMIIPPYVSAMFLLRDSTIVSPVIAVLAKLLRAVE